MVWSVSSDPRQTYPSVVICELKVEVAHVGVLVHREASGCGQCVASCGVRFVQHADDVGFVLVVIGREL